MAQSIKKENIISVDLGGTKILSALLDKNDNIISRVKTPTEVNRGEEYLVDKIVMTINKLLEKGGVDKQKVSAVCLGVPGTVNPFTGVIGDAPNLNIKNFNIKDALFRKIDLPVLIENDVNFGALGIKRFEFKDQVKNMLVVFIGTGIGGALIFDNKLYRGSSFFAGEIGHMKVNSNGSFSNKSKSSTFENIASRTAVVRAIEEDIKNNKKSIIKDLMKGKSKIKSSALASAVEADDAVVKKHLKKACKTIGAVLGSLTTLLNVDTIVLGGGVIEAMDDFMMPNIQKAFSKAALPEPGREVKIFATKLGDDAALYGGPVLAEEFLS